MLQQVQCWAVFNACGWLTTRSSSFFVTTNIQNSTQDILIKTFLQTEIPLKQRLIFEIRCVVIWLMIANTRYRTLKSNTESMVKQLYPHRTFQHTKKPSHQQAKSHAWKKSIHIIEQLRFSKKLDSRHTISACVPNLLPKGVYTDQYKSCRRKHTHQQHWR